jgi:hypothetical protein
MASGTFGCAAICSRKSSSSRTVSGSSRMGSRISDSSWLAAGVRWGACRGPVKSPGPGNIWMMTISGSLGPDSLSLLDAHA